MRNELITKINDLFDENINLKVRNEYLESQNKNPTIAPANKESTKTKLSEIDKKILKYGKSILYENVITHRWVDIEEDNDGNCVCQKFEKWVKNAIAFYSIPDNFSKEDILNIFHKELEEIYSKKKAEAIQEFEKEKAKEDD